MPMHAQRGTVVASPSVRPSVCPSQSGILSKRMHIWGVITQTRYIKFTITYLHIVKLFPPYGRSMIVVLLSATAVTKFQGNSLSGGALNTRGVGKCDFQQKSPFISDTVRDRTMVTMEP